LKFLVFFILCLVLLTGCNNNSSPINNENNYNTEQLSTNETESFNIVPTEETIASFSTKILDKSSNRQNNITIACNSLNGLVVKSGETFSFCNTLGPATPEDGYQKADTFDADGNVIQEYGGGKCQVSSTLYNAVLAVPTLAVVERHEHSGKVYYVEENKDACVSYGSCDFKFTNTNPFDIKLYFSNTDDSVNVSIVKISS